MASSATVGILRVLLSANSAEFETSMGRAGKSLKGVGQQGTAMSAVMTGVVAGGVAAVGLAAISLAKTLATTLVNSIGEVITRGGEVAGIASSFERLSGGAGQAESSLVTLRNATHRLVSDFDLMQSSNKAMLLGLGLSESEMGDLAKTATVLGRAMGMDATKSLDDLITALGRSSPMILDNLGLTVKVGEANESYAAKLGKTSKDLTDAEKKQAFMTAAMEAARTKVAELGDVQMTLTDRLMQVRTWYGNVFDEVSKGITSSPKLAAAFDGVARALAIAFGGDSQGLVTTIIGLVEGLAGATLTAAQVALGAADGIVRAWYFVQGVFYGSLDAILSVEAGMRGLAASAFEMAAKTPGVGSAFDGVATSMRSAANETTRLRDEYRQSAADANAAAAGQNGFSQAVQQVQFALTDARAKMDEAAAATRATGDAATGAKPPVDALGASLAGLGASAEGGAKGLHVITGHLDNITRFQIAGVLNPQLVDFQTETGNTSAALQELVDHIARVEDKAIKISGPLTSSMKLPWVQAKASVEQTTPVVQGFFSKVFGGASQLGGDISGIFQAAFEGGGGAAGAVKSFATKAVGSLLGMIPVVGPFISKFAGPIIAGFSKIAGKVKAMFQGFFGGPDKEELAGRGLVKTFEDDLIGALSAGQQAEAGGERWKQIVIAVRDAYIAAGRSAAEAEADVARLWKSSKEGGQASQAVIDEINRKMGETGAAAAEASGAVDQGSDAYAKLADEAEAAAQRAEVAQAKAASTTGEEWEQANIAAVLAVKEAEDAHQKMVDAMKDAATDASDSIDSIGESIARIPRDIEVNFRSAYTGPDIPGGNGDGYRAGTMGVHGSWFRRFALGGTPTVVHGDEAIITPQQAPAFAMDVIDSMGSRSAAATPSFEVAGSGGTWQVKVPLQLNGMTVAEALVEYIPAALRRRGV